MTVPYSRPLFGIAPRGGERGHKPRRTVELVAVPDRERPGELGNVFARFAEEASNGGCPLYTALAEGVSDDTHVLDIAFSARQPPVPNLLFAAVHYLLLRGAAHALTSFYASLTPDPSPAGDSYAHFRGFCMEHESELRDLVSTSLVQTNEVARCSYLRPAFAFIAEETQGQPLSLVDVGASAGLNLLWDRYAYDYKDHGLAGDGRSPVRIEVETRGDRSPPIPHDSPSVAFRTGIDLNPVDVTDPDSALWLRALVWPGHERRAGRLQAAMSLALSDPPALVAGNALHVLPEILANVPARTTLCIFHNHTLNQFSQGDRRQFSSLVDECSQDREVYLLSAEGRRGQNFVNLDLARIRNGNRSVHELAKVDPHGKWLEWIA